MPKHVGVANKADEGKENKTEDVNQRNTGKRTPHGLLRSAGADVCLLWDAPTNVFTERPILFILLILCCQNAQTIIVLQVCSFPADAL